MKKSKNQENQSLANYQISQLIFLEMQNMSHGSLFNLFNQKNIFLKNLKLESYQH